MTDSVGGLFAIGAIDFPLLSSDLKRFVDIPASGIRGAGVRGLARRIKSRGDSPLARMAPLVEESN